MIVTTIIAVFTSNSFRATFLERNKTDNSQVPGKTAPLAIRSRTICSRSNETTTACAAILKTGLLRLERSIGLYRERLRREQIYRLCSCQVTGRPVTVTRAHKGHTSMTRRKTPARSDGLTAREVAATERGSPVRASLGACHLSLVTSRDVIILLNSVVTPSTSDFGDAFS